MSYVAIARDCAGRHYNPPHVGYGETRDEAAASLWASWPGEPGCTTYNMNKTKRDRCHRDGSLGPAGDDGIDYHSNPSIPPYGWCRPEGQTELRETYKRIYASLAVVL